MNLIGYVRRSTDRQDLSMEQQRQKLEQFASAGGWKLVRYFEDDAISGSDMKRPGLEAMIAFAKSNADIAGVVAWERNRLARPKDPVDGLVLERDLLASGKRVFYAATGQEADRSFSSSICGLVEHQQNGDYLRKLSRDTMRGIVHRVEKGLWPGGPIPFGFDRLIRSADGKPKRIVRDTCDGCQIVLDAASGRVVETLAPGQRYEKQQSELCTLTLSEPARVEAVRKLFSDYAAGAPVRQLRDQLNRSGLRTSRGNIFTAATIHPKLRHQAYLGDCVYNRRTESKWHRHSAGSSVERMDEGLEQRPESDWIRVRDAWPAIIDCDTFDKVQRRLSETREQCRHVRGTAIRSEYLLTGVAVCGVCGGRLSGQTTTSGKGYRTRYYVCAAHHAGHHDRCPKRYKIPAQLIEEHIIALVKEDLAQLRDDGTLHQYVADELRRIGGSQVDAREQLQRRLSHLDQQVARLRDHLKALDPATAVGLGLYDESKAVMVERGQVEQELAALPPALPGLPEPGQLKERASTAFDRLDAVLATGTIEEKRALVGLYVEKIKADPDTHSVLISLYPALFSQVIAGGGFEPPTSGL